MVDDYNKRGSKPKKRVKKLVSYQEDFKKDSIDIQVEKKDEHKLSL